MSYKQRLMSFGSSLVYVHCEFDCVEPLWSFWNYTVDWAAAERAPVQPQPQE